jgi:GH25 family lysozyme M1 (1,4-beta-N-acetylmuramidase)
VHVSDRDLSILVTMMNVRTRKRCSPVRAIVLLVFFALCLRGCALVACRRSDTVTVVERERASRRLNPDGFVMRDGRYRFESAGLVCDRTGIDVSDHQDAIDWDAVARDGISFAMIRVGWRGTTEGGLHADEDFYANLNGARAAGIACGAYFFSQATSVEEAQAEAEFVLDLLGGCYLEYPVAFDYEVEHGTRVDGVSSATIAAAAETFCTTLDNAGYGPMLYGNTYDLARYGAETCQKWAVWCAEYDGSPSFDGIPVLWQYTNTGVVAGINSHVDLNLDLSGAAEL